MHLKLSSTLDRSEKVYCILKETLHIFNQENQFWSPPDHKIKIYKQKESYLLFKVHRPTALQSADIDSMIWMHENP